MTAVGPKLSITNDWSRDASLQQRVSGVQNESSRRVLDLGSADVSLDLPVGVAIAGFRGNFCVRRTGVDFASNETGEVCGTGGRRDA